MSEIKPFSPGSTVVIDQGSQRCSRARRYGLLVLCCLGIFPMSFNDGAIFPAIPFLAIDLHASESDLTWIISASKITSSSLLLISGRISDIYDPKYIFVCGVAVEGVLSICLGFSTTNVSFIVIRALSGIAASMIPPSALRLLVDVFPAPTEQARAIGLFIGSSSVGVAFAFIVGAAIIQFASWHWVFWFTALISLPVAVVGILLIPPSTKETNTTQIERWKHLDLLGVGIFTAALILLIFGVISGSQSGWASANAIAPLILGTLTFATFFFYESMIPSSVAAIPPSTWLLPNFIILFCVALIPRFWASTLSSTFSSLWQNVYHWSAIKTGLYLLPFGIVGLAISFTGPMARIISPKWILASSLGLMIIATILVHFANAPDRYLSFALPMIILSSVGEHLLHIHTTVASFLISPPSMAGTTGAILNSAFNLGSAVGLAVFNSIQTSVDAKHGGPTSFAGRAAGFWFIFTLLCVEAISLIVFYRIEAEKPDRHDEETNESEVSQPVEEIPVNTKVSNEKLSELQIPNV